MVDMTKVPLAICALACVSLAQASEPHPQLTYGAIKFAGESSNCVQEWIEDGSGKLYFNYCGNKSSAIEELGKLDETDPQYDQKKAILMQLIDTVTDSKK